MFHRAQTRTTASRVVPRAALLLTFLLAIAGSLLSASVASAAPGDTIWVNQYSSNARGDAFVDVARGPGDVYYCAGVTRATEETSALALVKYKADGTRLWVRTWKPKVAGGAAAVSVAVAADGDVVVAGTMGVAPPASAKGRDVVVLRYKPNGAREWICRWDGPAHKDDWAAGLALDGEGAACVAGVTRGSASGQDYLALAVSPAGKARWAWTYKGPTGRDAATAVAVDGGGNWYVTGSSQGAGGTLAAATAKISRRGFSVWSKRLQYGDGGRTAATGLVYRRVAGSRRLYLTGSAASQATGGDLLIAELAANTGARMHWAAVDGSGADDGGEAVVADAAGNVYAAGWTTDATSEVVHAYAARLSADGSVPWDQAVWLTPGDNEAYFQAADLDAAGNLVCGGYAVLPDKGPEAYVQGFWPTGGLRWLNISSGSASSVDICRAVLANASGVFAAGLVTRTSSGQDAQLKKIEP
jgi:hypothetical protein